MTATDGVLIGYGMDNRQPAWLRLAQAAAADIRRVDARSRVSMFHVRFSALRIEMATWPTDADKRSMIADIVRAAETASWSMCQRCGSREHIDRRPASTLCRSCRAVGGI